MTKEVFIQEFNKTHTVLKQIELMKKYLTGLSTDLTTTTTKLDEVENKLDNKLSVRSVNDNKLVDDNLVVNGKFTTESSTQLDGPLDVLASADFHEGADFEKKVIMSDDLNVTGKITNTGGIHTDGELYTDSDFQCYGTATFDGDVVCHSEMYKGNATEDNRYVTKSETSNIHCYSVQLTFTDTSNHNNDYFIMFNLFSKNDYNYTSSNITGSILTRIIFENSFNGQNRFISCTGRIGYTSTSSNLLIPYKIFVQYTNTLYCTYENKYQLGLYTKNLTTPTSITFEKIY